MPFTMENFTILGINSTFSDFDGKLPTQAWVAIIIMSILILPIVILNIAIVIVILKHKPIRTGSYLLILSLALADTCIGLFVIPGRISANFSEESIGDVICKMCAYTSFMSEAASVLSLTAISLDRVRAILWPLKPKLSNKKAWLIIICIWLIGIVYGLRGGLTFALKGVQVDLNRHILCIMSAPDAVVRRSLMVLDLVFLFIIPAVIVTVCYVAILFKTRKHMSRMETAHTDSTALRKKKLKAVRMSLLMISIFVFLHLPKHVMLMHASRDRVVKSQSVILMTAFLIIAFLNSVVNPILYGFLNIKIRSALCKICRQCRCTACCCLNAHRDPSHVQSSTGSDQQWIKDLRNDNKKPEILYGENTDASPKCVTEQNEIHCTVTPN